MSTHASPDRIPPMTLGWRIRMAREYAGMSQSDLAAATEIGRNTISTYESDGTERPKAIYLRAIALACGVDAEWLLSGSINGVTGQYRGPARGRHLAVV